MLSIPHRLTRAQFLALVDREHEQLELKTGIGRKAIQASAVAMSNADGGVILVGVTDERGIPGRRRDQGVDDEIHAAAFDAHNVGRIEIAEVSVDGTPVVAVSVHPRHDDVAHTSDGRVLVRQGGHNRALPPREVSELYLRRSRLRFELTDSGVDFAEVDIALAAELARVFSWAKPADHTRWQERGLANSEHLTVAGALVLTDPARTLSAGKFRIDVRQYESDNGAGYVSRRVIGGPVQTQVLEAAEMVSALVGTEMIFTGARRHDVPRLPKRVIREVIANAVAHRTYDHDATPIVVELRPTRVTVVSPGRLPESVTVRTLRQAQAARNHAVIDVLRRFGLAEDSGQGIDLIEDQMRLELLADPVFSETTTSFRVDLPLRGMISTTERGWLAELEHTGLLQHDDRSLLLVASREDRVTNRSARSALGVDSTTARARLARLRELGLLIQHGTRGRAYYSLGTVGPELSPDAVVLDAATTQLVTNRLVRELTGLDRVPARRLLARLVAEGRLTQHGQRRGTTYSLPE